MNAFLVAVLAISTFSFNLEATGESINVSKFSIENVTELSNKNQTLSDKSALHVLAETLLNFKIDLALDFFEFIDEEQVFLFDELFDSVSIDCMLEKYKKRSLFHLIPSLLAENDLWSTVNFAKIGFLCMNGYENTFSRLFDTLKNHVVITEMISEAEKIIDIDRIANCIFRYAKLHNIDNIAGLEIDETGASHDDKCLFWINVFDELETSYRKITSNSIFDNNSCYLKLFTSIKNFSINFFELLKSSLEGKRNEKIQEKLNRELDAFIDQALSCVKNDSA